MALGHYEVGNLVPVFANFYWWTDAAVDLFFCLSGFTLSFAYGAGIADRLSFRNYFVARIARIYPLYLLTLVLCAFMVERLTKFEYTVNLWDFVRQLAMVNAWSFVSSGTHWNAPAWSVSVEFFCYVFIFPALFYLSRRMLRQDWRMRMPLATVSMGCGYVVFACFTNGMIFKCGRDAACHISEMTFAVGLLRGLFGFAAGWAAYGSFVRRDPASVWAARNANLIAGALLAVVLAGWTGTPLVQLMMLGFPVLVLAVSSGPSTTTRLLSSGPFHYLGKISYSIYLLHMPVAYFGWRWAGLFGENPIRSVWSTLVLVATLFAVSALSYHLVEMPLRQTLRRAWQTPGPADPAPRAERRWLRAASVAAFTGLVAIGMGQVGWTPNYVAPGQELTGYPTFEHLTRDGWSTREAWGIWSTGKDSMLVLELPDGAPDRLGLRIKGSFFVNDRHPRMTVRLTANGVEIGTFVATEANNAIDATLPLPASLQSTRARTIRIGF